MVWWMAGGSQGKGERDLVYGTARLEINVHDIPSTILFNGGNVEKYFVHVGLWRFVFLFFFFHFFFFPPDGFTRREDPLKNRIPFHVFSSSVIRDNGGLSFDNDDYRVFDRSKALLFRF